MSIIQGTSKAAGGGYEIDQSIRFDKTASSHLSNTYGSAGDRKTWTFSTWFKRGKIDGTRQILFAATGQAYLQVGPDAASREMITILNEGSGTDLNWYTTQVFRDASAWYHLVWQFDSTQATADDRTKLYINGSQVTDFTKAATPAQNFEGAISNAVEHKIGEGHTAANYFDGYQAEINFIDGTALDPTSFGEYNDDGVWIPKAYTGSYGTNGFYITGATASDLGEDFSGNGNDFTSSGLATTDQRTDTPTNNHCTFNPLWIDTYTLSDGNLVTSTGADASALGTMAVDATDSDGWYWEMKVTTAATYPGVGIILASQTSLVANTALSNTNTNRYYYEGWSGNFNNQNSTSAYGSTWSGTANKVIGVYLKGGALWFSIDGVVQNSGDPSTASTGAAITGLTGDFYPVVVYAAGSGTQAAWTAQFAEADWGTTPPTGYKALNTANLATPSITDGSAYFQPTLYTGTGSSLAVTQSGNSTFQPDLVWIKGRSGATEHVLTDAVRGVTKELSSNDGGAEETVAQGLTTFGSSGFTVGTDGSYNTSSATYVGWQWKANGAGSSNTDGSINTTATSVNTTAGFSISTYTGTGSNATVGHGLGIAPKMVIVKRRNSTSSWRVYHAGLTSAAYVLNMESTGAQGVNATVWNSTDPTSSVFSIGTNAEVNTSGGTYVAYCFAEIPGYSSIGSYTGNGSATDGTFVATGFTPAFIMYKVTSTTDSWEMYDTQRRTINPYGTQVKANLSNAETDDTRIDILSNGFKARSTNTAVNGSGATYIYMAFAEHPFGGDGVAPATAR